MDKMLIMSLLIKQAMETDLIDAYNEKLTKIDVSERATLLNKLFRYIKTNQNEKNN